MIPKSFEEWKHCIIVDCQINLTKEFAERRLAVYQNPESRETRKFISLYGQQHLDRVVHWFGRIAMAQ